MCDEGKEVGDKWYEVGGYQWRGCETAGDRVK